MFITLDLWELSAAFGCMFLLGGLLYAVWKDWRKE
jgi:hypothetical protein